MAKPRDIRRSGFYGENDSYFDAPLAKRMHEAYSAAGGKAQLIAYGAFKGDAHRTFSDGDGLKIWWPETERFLQTLGLPTAVLPRSVSEDPELAALSDTQRIPSIQDNCARSYNLFLDADYPGAHTRSHPTANAVMRTEEKIRRSAQSSSASGAPRKPASSTP